MRNILGRKHEQQLLQKILDSNEPEFVALYGRRRIGKTFLIREFFQNNDCLFFDSTGTKDGIMSEQIDHFTTRIGEVFLDSDSLERKQNWRSTFKLLTERIQAVPSSQKIVLFFDEFPWMCTTNSKLLQALEYYWNQYWSKVSNVKLIICGSAASFIINKIINNKGGLHNRVTHTMLLEPFKLKDVSIFLSAKGFKLNNEQILRIYLFCGGVPYYLKQLNPHASVCENIDQLAFSHNSFFLREFNNLLGALFDDPEAGIAIVRHLSKSKSGISQEKLFKEIDFLSKGGTAQKLLHALCDAGFLMRFKPYGQKQGTSYRLIDEYLLFYFQWIEPLKNSLQEYALESGYWQQIEGSSKWHNWAGYAFEGLCIKNLSSIRQALKISPTAIPGSWRYIPTAKSGKKGAQIDLLFDRDDDAITLFEIKYTQKPFVIDKNYAQILNQKMDVFQQRTDTKKQLFWVLISANGIKPNQYSKAICSTYIDLSAFFDNY